MIRSSREQSSRRMLARYDPISPPDRERIRVRLKARRFNEFAKCYRLVPLTPAAPGQQRPSTQEQHGSGIRLGYYDKPCDEGFGICASCRRIDVRTVNARRPVAHCKGGIKKGRSASAEVAHIHQQIAPGGVVVKRGGQIDDDIEILRTVRRTCERAGEVSGPRANTTVSSGPTLLA